jgi:hypothetical protein
MLVYEGGKVGFTHSLVLLDGVFTVWAKNIFSEGGSRLGYVA